MNGEPKLMKIPKKLKRKFKYGMIKESKSGNSKWVNMFYYTTPILDSLQENFSLNGKDLMLSKKFIVLEPSK